MKKFVCSLLNKIQAAGTCLALAAAVLSPVVASATSQAVRPLPEMTSCSWNRPGVNPFMGDVVGAVDRYPDIPADVRARLKARMAKREYDDLVSIRRDKIVGDRGQQYGSTIRDMHFGDGQLCHTVSREAWSASMQERGLVYCESGHCILVPTVCRNVSRIAARGVSPERAEAIEAPDAPFAVLPPVDAPPVAVLAPVDALPVVLVPAGAGVGPLETVVPLGIDRGAPSFGAVASPAAVSAAPVSFASGAPGATSGPGTLQASSVDVPIAPAVPEPATWASMMAGLIGLLIASRVRVARRDADVR